MSHPQNSPERIGKGMIVVAWLLALGLLTLIFDGWLERARNPNREPTGISTDEGLREVALLRNRHGHYVATGRINGEPLEFLLDTGATTVSVPAGAARRLGLRPGAPQQVMTANGVVTVYATVLERVELGPLSLYNVRAHINPHMGGEAALLGMSFLKELEFTQRGDSLILRQHPL